MSRNKVNHNPLPYDLSLICKVFQLEVGGYCQVLKDWMSATYTLDPLQKLLYDSLTEETEEDGGYLFGHNWHFTTLIGNRYCSSRQYDARLPNDLLQIIFNMRKLKELILNR